MVRLHHRSARGPVQLTAIPLAALAALLYFAARARLNPRTRCTTCDGKAPDDGHGNYHCRTCGGHPERLRFGAWVQRAMGIPVRRAKPGAKSNRWGL
jgi:hypothetical protein